MLQNDNIRQKLTFSCNKTKEDMIKVDF